MVNPLTALSVGLILIAIFVFVFIPNKGILARIYKSRRINKRVLIEDALKHLYNNEYNSIGSTLNSIAGNLSIPADDAAELITKLEAMGLVSSSGNNLQLTTEGRTYALKIIRVHRLWEKYLADETGIDELEWHTSAEKIEHSMSPEQANELAAQIGNPVFDPHGDPIPSSKGDLPIKKGRPLSELKPGEFASIIHIEDEPLAIYTQLVAEGLYPGMQVRMLEYGHERVRFTANGEECILAPLFVKNITVATVKNEIKIDKKLRRLSSLGIGESGKVLAISKSCRGQQRRRLMDLGVVPGTEITAELRSAGGDPTAYKIKEASIALRKKEADKIFLIPEEVDE